MSDFNPIAEFRSSLSRTNACSTHPALTRSDSPEMAALWNETVQLCSESARREHLRWLARNDLFFLCVYVLNRKHFIRNERTAAWTFARCTEVQNDPDNHLDAWPRESFKCSRSDTLITLADGSRKAIVNMAVGDRIMAVGHDGKATVSQIVQVAATGRKLIRTFTTRSGRQFSITDEHRMMGPDGWVTGEGLRVGGWVATPRGIVRQPEETLTVAECAYLGFIMADGSTTQGNASFTNFDEPVIQRFVETCQACGFEVNSRPYGDILIRKSRPFQRRMGIQGCKSTNKRVPQELFHQPDEHLWNFLGAFVDCDGHVTDGKSGHGVIVSLANEGLIDDLRHVCDLLGIHATVSKKRENECAGFWSLSIYEQKALRKLVEWLPLAHAEKKNRLTMWAYRDTRHDRSDPIPAGWERMLDHSVD